MRWQCRASRDACGLQVNHEPIAIEARILPVPEIMVTEKERVGNSRVRPALPPLWPAQRVRVLTDAGAGGVVQEAGNWDHRTRLYAPVALNCWAIMITSALPFSSRGCSLRVRCPLLPRAC